MSFHSLEYALLLPLALLAYFWMPGRLRWIALLLASVLFYASWRIDFLGLLLFSAAVDYSVGRALSAVHSQGWRRVLMGVSLTCNLGLLIAFKFFTQTANGWFQVAFTPTDGAATPMLFLLPLGISFYTFQTLGYTIDVFRNKREPERHAGYFAVYVMFFPQLIAGPIERAGRFIPQLRRVNDWDWARGATGLGLIIIGLFKKLVIADGLGRWIGTQMVHWEAASSLTLASVSLGTAYRFYADLSAYADIAIGSALLFGIKLSQNFNRPFAAESISAFWLRWHITVSNWFRDYLYIPLVRRLGANSAARFIATQITMIVIGLWHGGTLNWLVIGTVSGLIISISNLGRKRVIASGVYGPTIKRSYDWGERILLWPFLLFLGSMVALPDFSDAVQMLGRIAMLPAELIRMDRSTLPAWPLYLAVAIIALEVFQWFDVKYSVHSRLATRSYALALSFYLMLSVLIIVFGTFDTPDFLYFQF